VQSWMMKINLLTILMTSTIPVHRLHKCYSQKSVGK
jgi:hypothetical protein